MLIPIYMDIEGPFPRCPYDDLLVVDGAGQRLRTCGGPLQPNAYVRAAPVVVYGTVTFRFRSDSSVAASGFVILYEPFN